VPDPSDRPHPDGQRRTCQRGRATAEQLHSLACQTESKFYVAGQRFSLQDNLLTVRGRDLADQGSCPGTTCALLTNPTA